MILRRVSWVVLTIFNAANRGYCESATVYGQTALARVPLGFEENVGQAERGFQFVARAGQYEVMLSSKEAILRLPSSRIRMYVLGANSSASLQGVEPQSGTSNYFLGSDPKLWKKNIRHFRRVQCNNIYPGITLAYHGDGSRLEYDWILAAGANPSQIRTRFSGLRGMRLDKHGDLVLTTKDGVVSHHKPLIFQESDTGRIQIEGRFRLFKNSVVGYSVSKYNHDLPLIIDPVLAYASYLGGTGTDRATAVAADKDGNAYVVGYTSSIDFPLTGTILGNNDWLHCSSCRNNDSGAAFVTKINAAGNQVLYSTFIGGSQNAGANAVAVDSAGHAYVGGSASGTFPQVGPLNPSKAIAQQIDAFVVKLSSSGDTLLYSSLIGGDGNDILYSLAVDAAGNAYIGGTTGGSLTTSFPTTPGAFQTSLSPQGSTAWSSY